MNQPTSDTTCPRCGSNRPCRPDAISDCPCRSLVLSEGELAYIRAYTESQFGTYVCLCPFCLVELQVRYRYEAV